MYNRGMPVKVNLKSVILYAIYAAALLCFNSAAGGVPLGASLCFAMLVCGANIIAAPVIYVLCSAINLSLTASIITLAEGLFLMAITYAYRRTNRKIRFEAYIYIAIATLPFILFSPWSGIDSLIFTDNAYAIKSICAAGVVIFYIPCFKCIYACMYRVYRCKLSRDELISLAAVYCVAGYGLFKISGGYAAYCFTFIVTVLGVRLMKSPSAVVAACAFSAPLCLFDLSFAPITECVILAVIALIFCNYGRFTPCLATGVAAALRFLYVGFYDGSAAVIAIRAALLFSSAIACALPSDKKLKHIREKLTCKSKLPQTEVAHFKARTGEKLYRLSEVFREIECAFAEMGDDVDETAAKKRALAELQNRCCTNCDRLRRCRHSNVFSGLSKLVAAGCAKGKVSLIDLPPEVTTNCARANDVIAVLNGLLAEYRRFMAEAENLKSGRKLLAEQANGIAEVMKNCAVDVTRRTSDNHELENALKDNLSRRGIVCTELYMRGDEDVELCAAVAGKVNGGEMGAILSESAGRKFVLKDKTVIDDDSSILVFSAPPALDAAFGVAYAIKDGGAVSGDTHSVIRVNDHSFLMVLSDGMGSGEYANKVSSTAISLIEAFYRAEMPEDTVLDTINKLITFSREERFACIDIAAVNLNSGTASFIKIGSPVAIIVRDGEIRVLESQSLPLGILDNLKPSTCTEQLKSGDIITFMSDGVTSAFNSTPELYDFLQILKPLNPQTLADKILAAALARTNGKAPDDMTVLCTRIF